MKALRLAPLLALALLLHLVPASGSAPGTTVHIVTPKGNTRDIDLSTQEARVDVLGAEYELRSRNGKTRTVTVKEGFSIGTVLDIAHIDPEDITYLEIGRPGGGTVKLSRKQIEDDGQMPPVVYIDGSHIRFLRPEAGADDANAADAVTITGDDLSVMLSKGKLLTVSATATPAKIEPGATVTFTADGAAGAGEPVTYTWDFGDGSDPKTGPTVKHTFANDGTFDVNLEAKSGEDADATTAKDALSLKVGTGGPTGASGATGDTGDGSSSSDTGGTYYGGSGGGSSFDDSSVDAGSSSDSGSSSSSGGSSSFSEPADPTPSSSASSGDSGPEGPVDSIPLLDGRLLNSTSLGPNLVQALAGPTGKAGAARAAAARTDDGSDDKLLTVPVVAWDVGGALLLVGAGALLEAPRAPQVGGRDMSVLAAGKVEDVLFDIADALRYPVLILAGLALLVVLLEMGALLAELLARRGRGFARVEDIVNNARYYLGQNDAESAVYFLNQGAYNAAMSDAMRSVIDNRGNPEADERVAKRMAEYDYRSLRRLERTRILVRAGPALGLMGTLIPLSPALAALAKGDVNRLTDNLRVAFSVTVAGLLIGMIAFAVSIVRDRLYAQDFSDVEYVVAALSPVAARLPLAPPPPPAPVPESKEEAAPVEESTPPPSESPPTEAQPPPESTPPGLPASEAPSQPPPPPATEPAPTQSPAPGSTPGMTSGDPL